METDFMSWIRSLNEVAAKHGNPEYVTKGNEESWREYFDDEYSPEDAYAEDYRHA